jgi:hypothetical protein
MLIFGAPEVLGSENKGKCSQSGKEVKEFKEFENSFALSSLTTFSLC